MERKCANAHGILTDQPSAEAIGKYWEGVLEVPGNNNPKDPAIREWRAVAKQVKVDPTEDEHDPENWNYAWTVALKKARNWKVPGHDGICVFWWKKLPQAAGVLRQLIGRIVEKGSDIPD